MRFLLLIISILSLSTFALDTKLTLELINKESSWDVGEIKDFKIMLHPISEVSDQDIKKSLLSRNFVDMIKILKIKKQFILKENPEYYIVEARGVLISEPKPNFPKIWDYRGMAVAVDYSAISFSNTPVSRQDFFVFDKSVPGQLSPLMILLISITAIVVLILIFIFFRKIKTKNAQKKHWQNIVDEFKRVSDRKGHEYIYSNRHKFYEIFSNKDAYVEYLNLTNKVQYKKDWDQSDLITLEEAHRKAKENIVVR
ncbi:hypothetical protein DAY19_05245 [Halobacteriovorax vibrionivorans]|uniref:Uncharacterized protein n=1 Tax=Halobacteriovorax vibrionivorans TaxID=2152716 RepID=A0ABY0IMS4_9BACT|nr:MULTISPECIES: hypothetical protein [Halobacteriovorax]RZF23176.1 hypothetical protein DAY19_05245 [Halobacteriovorax vibrionivorans]TGD45916.1 hypothetical protein EP118_13995 [Halobacteriovorax sp. Y22]